MQLKRTNFLHGYLTVYLSLILTIMISLCLTLIIGVRENTRRMQIECVTDIGMNSILAEYHRELFEQYDLLFIDTSYGTNTPSYHETADHLKHYVRMNLGGDEILFSSVLYRDLLKLELDKVGILEVSVASDNEGAVLRRQAVEVIKQRSGITYLQQIQNWFTIVQRYKLLERDILSEQKAAIAELESWDGREVSDNGVKNRISVEAPGKDIVSFWEAGVLNLIVDDIADLSNQEVNLGSYISNREVLSGTGVWQAVDYEDNWMDQLFFHQYVLTYTGRYDKPKDNSLLKYQTEYILEGGGNDLHNLQNIANKLLGLRAVANYIYLTNDTEKMKAVEIVARVLSTLVMFPAIEPLFQTVLVLAWAMAESIYDVTQLFNGNRIPLMKTEESWHYTLDEILSFGMVDKEEKENSGICYSDYLHIFLCFQSKKTTTTRLMDIMEMDIRQTEGNENFRMDGCIDSIRAVLNFSGKDQKGYTIDRVYGY